MSIGNIGWRQNSKDARRACRSANLHLVIYRFNYTLNFNLDNALLR